MKKILGLFLMGLFVLSLSACGAFSQDDIDTAIDCVENPDDPACEDIIPDDDDNDTPVDERTAEEIFIDTIIETYENDGDLTFLSTTIEGMNFDDALGQTTSIYFEVTEDIDEVHYIDVTFTDKMVDNSGLVILERQIVLDVDGEESIDITMYFEEVVNGVHVYVEQAPLKAEMDQTTQDYLSWMGFESTYALFKFDDTLENVIQIEVMKDLLVDMMYDEFGSDIFIQIQDDLEFELGIDLNPYGVDLDDLFNTLVINEDVTGFETKVRAIDYDGIILELDLLYLAPELSSLLGDMDGADGTTDGMIGSIDIAASQTILTNDGTEIFINGLTDTQQDDLVELVVKPVIEQMVVQSLTEDLNIITEYETAVRTLLTEYETELAASGVTVGDLDAAVNFETWVNSLSDDQIQAINSIGMVKDSATGEYYYQDIMWHMNDIEYKRQEMIEFLTTHQTALEAITYETNTIDVTQMLTDLNTGGLTLFLQNLDATDIEILTEGYVYPKIETLKSYIDDGEGAEGVLITVWGDPHIEPIIRDIPHFDGETWLTNIVAIDADAIVNETLDSEALLLAIRGGQTTFDTYLTNLATTAPNMASLLEAFSPTVLYLEQYSDYVDDVEYAFNALSQFEPYMSIDYYMNDEMMDATLTRTNDTTLLVDMAMPVSTYTTLFDNLVGDLYVYLSGFSTLDDLQLLDLAMYDNHLECLDTATDCEDIIYYTDIYAELEQLEALEMQMEYDPNNLNEMNMAMDLTAFSNAIVSNIYADISSDPEFTPNADNGILTGVNELTINTNLTTSATVTVPTDTDDVNAIMTEAAKMNLIYIAEDLLYDVDYYDTSESTDLSSIVNTPRTLESFNWGLDTSGVIDDTLSTITWDGSEYSVELYWIDGTQVFTGPISDSDFTTYFTDYDINSEASYDALITMIDDTNYSVTKLFMYYFFE